MTEDNHELTDAEIDAAFERITEAAGLDLLVVLRILNPDLLGAIDGKGLLHFIDNEETTVCGETIAHVVGSPYKHGEKGRAVMLRIMESFGLTIVDDWDQVREAIVELAKEGERGIDEALCAGCHEIAQTL